MWHEMVAAHDYVVPRLPTHAKNLYDGFSMEKIGSYVADFGFGGAMALQIDVFATEGSCYENADSVRTDTLALFDFTNLFADTASGSFDMQFLMNQVTLMQTKV